MKNKILSLLKNSDEFISGQKLSEEFGMSRAAIWKYINALKEEGYNIESVSRKGYRLISSPDLLKYEEIKPFLNTEVIARKIVHFDTIGSTNTEAKILAEKGEPEGTVLLSEEQTSGRGRLGRSWSSPKYTAISMSIILRPDISPIHVAKVTQVGAAAVALACNEMGIDAYIKWPNDIILNNRKVCGILTEMSAELNKINYVVMGIGINVNIEAEDFPDEIKPIATSFKGEYNKKFSRQELCGRILNHFEKLYNSFCEDGNASDALEVCREKSIVLGREINIIQNNTATRVKALDIDSEGELIVEYADGKANKVISGEVSIRGINGYI